MKKKRKSIIGIDISKKTFDVALGQNVAQPSVSHSSFPNSLKGFEKLDAWLGEKQILWKDVLICLENTGIYHRLLCSFLLSKKALVWVETPVQIKWSMGLQRGKSDKVDAQRIMTYAFRNQDKVKPYTPQDKTIQKIADYLALRIRLQQCIHRLEVPIKELSAAGLTEAASDAKKACKKSIKAIKDELKLIDQKIRKVIHKDKNIAQKYQYATSVTSVGFVAGAYLLVYTQGFTRFDSAKQLAAYAGIAPYEYSSGTSIKGRTKVHPMANKNLKSILHMCAISAITHSPELRAYFKRKVNEGKNKMLVINAIRNKIIRRVFACVKNQKYYLESYSQ